VVSGPVSVTGVTTVSASDQFERCPRLSRAINRNVYCWPDPRWPVIVVLVTAPTLALKTMSPNSW
jgi:hypothetical protein